MINRILIFIICCAATSIHAQTLEEHYAAAKAAYAERDYELFYTSINKAHELHPYHQVILYQKGIAAALTGHHEEAIKSLREAILINATFSLDSPDLLSIAGSKEFSDLKEFQKEIQRQIIQSDTAVVLKDRALHLESISAGRKSGTFYGSSIRKRKIIQIDKKGAVTDFTNTATNGIAAVMCTKINKETKELWMCASPLPEMLDYDSTSHSAVYQFDLRSGNLLHKYKNDTLRNSVFGDLLINQEGEVFVSDSRNNIILKANQTSHTLEVFYQSEAFWNVQGITMSEDGGFMFIADYIKGIFRLDMRTKELAYLKREVLMSLKGIDGLIYYEGSLVAIQNGINPIRVTRYYLNKELNSITNATIIDRAHEAFNEPTNGFIKGKILYYVANSQWSAYDDDHQPIVDKLQDIVILKYKLD